jgi:hypothetical protein
MRLGRRRKKKWPWKRQSEKAEQSPKRIDGNQSEMGRMAMKYREVKGRLFSVNFKKEDQKRDSPMD